MIHRRIFTFLEEQVEQQLRKLQLAELSILKTIDNFCAEHGIRYSLYLGTMLGAARHGGFIPWDDDLDICMLREEYEKFLELWKEFGPPGYILQNKENTPNFAPAFSKIRKDHTTFLSQEDVGKGYHVGIYVDIFPIDRLPNGAFPRLLFTYRSLKYLLFSREFIPPEGSLLEKAVASILLRLYPPQKRQNARDRLRQKITKNKGNHALEAVCIETVELMGKHMPGAMFDSYVRIPFEDGHFMCVKDWDLCLKIRYGDYKKLPPEEQRQWKHHPVCIDFEKNYDEIS